MKIKVRIGDKDYQVEISDLNSRPILAVVDGETFEVWPEINSRNDIENSGSQTVSTAPRAISALKPTSAISSARDVLSPLPGVVVGLSAKPGSEVHVGQELCVIEAMKMKNIIRAGRPGLIAEVHVSMGQQVMPRQRLLTFTD